MKLLLRHVERRGKRAEIQSSTYRFSIILEVLPYGHGRDSGSCEGKPGSNSNSGGAKLCACSSVHCSAAITLAVRARKKRFVESDTRHRQVDSCLQTTGDRVEVEIVLALFDL